MSEGKVHSGHVLLALIERFDWFANRMMTEFDVDGGRADLVFITRSRYLTEIEIKTSRSDWNADASKAKWKRDRPHVSRFYYAVPAPLAENIPDWIPESAGIIAVHLDKFGLPYSREIRPAKRKRCTQISEKQIGWLHEAAYYRFWRSQVSGLRERFYVQPPPLKFEAAA